MKNYFKTKRVKITLAIVLLLVAVRIALPYVLLHFANKTLAEMDGYYGHIEDLDLCLLRGAYSLDSIYLNRIDESNGEETRFFSSKVIDLSVQWRPILKGRVVGELVFENPYLRFVQDKVEISDIAQDSSDFRELLNEFMPIEVNRTEIKNGTLVYNDYSMEPNIKMSMTSLNATALNLSNVDNPNGKLPATLDATGTAYGGEINLGMKLNILSKPNAFDLNLEAADVQLPELNDFFKAYVGADVNKGTFHLYTEMATNENKFEGYVKPFVKDLDVLQWNGQDRADPFFQKIWEGAVGGIAKIVENRKKDEIATKIPLSGTLDEPEPNIVSAVFSTLRHAFFKSIQASFDNNIAFENVVVDETQDGKQAKDGKEKKGFFKRLFSKKED